MKTINTLLTGVVTMTAFTLASCSGGKLQPENGKGAEEAKTGATTQEVKTYKVGTNPVFAPFEYTNQAGDILGFDIDVMDAIAKDRNVKFTYKNVPWDGIFASLESGDVDVLSSAITITDERKQRMDFTDSYYEVTQLIVLPKGKQVNNVEELKSLGKIGVVAAQTGDILMQQYLGPTSSKIARYDTLPLMFKEIQAGGADAGVSDSAAILYYMKSNPDMEGYSLVKFDDFPLEKYGMAVNKGNTELLDLINTGLKNIKADGTYDKIMDKYFSESSTKELSAKAEEAAQNAQEAVKDAAKEVKDQADETAAQAGSALQNAVNAAKQAAGDAVDKTKEVAHDAAEATLEAGAAVKQKAEDALDATKEAAGAAVDKTKEVAHDAAEATREAAGAAVDKTKEVAHDAAEATREAGAAAKEKASDAVDATREAAGAAVDKTKEVAHDAAEATREAGAAAKEKASDAIDATREAAGAAVDKTKEVAHDAAEATREAGAAAKEKASDAVDATKEAAGAAVDATKEAAGAAVDATKEAASAAVDKTKEVAHGAAEAIKNAAHNAAQKVAEATE